MKIYRLQYEPGYASLDSQQRDPVQRDYAKHVQTNHGDPSIISGWRGVELYLLNPLDPVSDFLWWGYYLCCLKETFVRMADVIERDVVPLPVRIENVPGDYVLLFVRNAVRITRDEEIKAWFEKHGWYHDMPYLFNREGLARSQLFLNPTFLKGQILCASGFGDEASDFYLQYRKLGLRGIEFIELKERR